jgi:hypothetical protein
MEKASSFFRFAEKAKQETSMKHIARSVLGITSGKTQLTQPQLVRTSNQMTIQVSSIYFRMH